MHVVVPDTMIICVQNHIQCNQNATEYGNIMQVCRGVVFKQSPMASSRKCVGSFALKEEGYKNSSFIWVKCTQDVYAH